MRGRKTRRLLPGRRWLLAAALVCTGANGHAEPGTALPVPGGSAGAGQQLPDFRSDLIELPRYRSPAGSSAVKASAPAGNVRLGYDRGFDEQQLRTPPPPYERMRANMREPQPATVLKLHLR